MSDDEKVDDDDKVDGVVPLPAEFDPSDLGGPSYEEPAETGIREFLPWHKPRKHYVRQKQWIASLASLLDERSSANDAINYLGLPGTDLLDVRAIHSGICLPRGVDIRFTGFDFDAGKSNAQGLNLAISLQEVKLLKHVLPQSDVYLGDIRSLGRASSVNYRQAQSSGPYDVVNLDLCGFALADPPTVEDSIYSALRSVLAIQDRHSKPWLLFLTTRVGREDMDDESVSRLVRRLAEILSECDGLRRELFEFFDVTDMSSLDIGALRDDRLVACAALALSSWIFETAQRNMPSRVNIKSSFGYRVNYATAHPDMISLVYRFNPLVAVPRDPLGLSGAWPESRVDSCAAIGQFHSRISNTRDIDALLDGDDELRGRVIEEASLLMEMARYDRQKYVKWASELADGTS